MGARTDVCERYGESISRTAAIAKKNDFRDRSLAEVIRDYFDNSYKSVVSALAEEEKISVDELREIIDLIESKNTENK